MTFMGDFFEFFINIPIPLLLIVAIAFVVLCGVIGRKYNNGRVWKVVSFIILALWFAALICVTVTGRDAWICSITWNPFERIIKATNLHMALRDAISNILLFVPLGMVGPFLLQGISKKPVLETIFYGLIISIIIETTQYVFSIGFSQTEDVIMNVLGTAIGTVAYIIAKYERKTI